MENDKMKNYNLMKQPPVSALRTIGGGKLKGFTDINPQWRFEIMTTVYGACGVGWKYEIIRFWNETVGDEILAFCEIKLYIKDGENCWSDPIPGIGGNQLSSWQNKKDYNTGEQKTVLQPNDEAYKMALTDALSVAMKCLGVAADIYAGLWDGSKYRYENSDEPASKPQQSKPAPKPEPAPKEQEAKPIQDALTLTDLLLDLHDGNKAQAMSTMNKLILDREINPVAKTVDLSRENIEHLISDVKALIAEKNKGK
jgi:hypothetical protein